MTEQAKKLKESVCEASSSGGGDEDVQGKLEQFYARLEMNRREARTRETLARALASEEQEMKEKLQAMEAEQVCSCSWFDLCFTYSNWVGKG